MSDGLAKVLLASLHNTSPILSATCVIQEAGSDLYLKMDRVKLMTYLKKKSEELSQFILDKGGLLEYSLLKKEIKIKDAQEFALEHISGMVSAEIFSDLVKELGLVEKDLFQKPANALLRGPTESPNEKYGKTKTFKRSKSPPKAEPPKGGLHNFFVKKT